jgi:hypothetical protein
VGDFFIFIVCFFIIYYSLFLIVCCQMLSKLLAMLGTATTASNGMRLALFGMQNNI